MVKTSPQKLPYNNAVIKVVFPITRILFQSDLPKALLTRMDPALTKSHRNHKGKSGAAQGNLVGSLRNGTDRSDNDAGNREGTHFYAQLYTAGNPNSQ